MNGITPFMETMMAFEYRTKQFRVYQSGLAFFLHSASLFLLLKIARRVFKANANDASLMLKTFLAVWIIEDMLALPYTVFITAFWRPVYLSYYSRVSFFVVLWERSFSCSIPIAVLCLTLDRSLTLILGVNYRPFHSKLLCVACCMLMSACSLMALYLYLHPEFMGAEERKLYEALKCQDRLCFFQQSDDWQFLVRVSVGTLNFMCSLLFFALLHYQHFKQQAFVQRSSLRSSANAFIVYAVTSEVLLNFLPHAGCLIFEMLMSVSISSTFGTYSRFVTSVDALICAFMYYRRMRKSHMQYSVSAISAQSTSTNRPRVAVRSRMFPKMKLYKRQTTAIRPFSAPYSIA